MPPRKPLDDEIAKAIADKAAADARLSALLKAQAELITALVRDEDLHVHRPSVNTGEHKMQLDNRLAISKARSATSEDPFFATIRAAKPKGFTLRSLAKRIGEQASLLSMQRKGDRPIPTERAKLIEELTGWPADKKHWPGGLS